jgi:hemolysin III
VILTIIWGLALIGFYSKVVTRHRVNAIATHSYVLLGWVPALALLGFVPLGCLTWIAVGGLTYTLGTLFLLMDGRFRFFHATWHVLVIAASASHYYAIITYVALQNVNPAATVP